MPNAILLIAGSSHQSHERFSDISRGRQCCFMIYSGLLCVPSCPVRHLDNATVDKILVEGDMMYLNALDCQSIPDTVGHIFPDLSAKSSSLDCSIARH